MRSADTGRYLAFCCAIPLLASQVRAASPEWERLPDGSTGQIAEFRAGDGAAIAAYIRKPDGRGPFPAILILHEGDASPEAAYAVGRSAHAPVADFVRAGWVVYSIDYRPHALWHPVEWQDSASAFETVSRLPFVDAKRIALMGIGHGGYVAARMASRVPARCSILCSPTALDSIALAKAVQGGAKIDDQETSQFLHDMEKTYGATIAEIATTPEAFGRTSPLTEAMRVRCPTLIISGKNDISAPLSVAQAYANRLDAMAQDVETYFPDNGPKGFYNGKPEIPETREAQNRMVAFLREHMGVAPVGTARRNRWGGSGIPLTWVDPDRIEPPLMKYRTFHSDTIGSEVSYLVYLPPGYGQTTKRYPVLYYLHGSNSRERVGADIVERLDPAIRRGKAPAMIAVFVNGLGGETMYCDSRDGKWPFETVFVKDFIPHVDATYRTIASREDRAIEGFSMGGFGAAHFGFKYPALFGVVSITDPALIGPGLVIPESPKAWPRLFQEAMSNDLEYYYSNEPFTLVKRNADAIRGRTAIRIVSRGMADANWVVPRCLELHKLLDEYGIANQIDVRWRVDAHSPRLMYDDMGDNGFTFFMKAFAK